jgi:outer membrane protein insertion porin family
MITHPWARIVRLTAYGLAWTCLLIGATVGGPRAQQAPPPAQPTEQPPPAPTAPPSPPGPAPAQPTEQPPPAPAQPASPPGPAPAQPTEQPPTLTPPSPFVPPPGVPQPTLPPQKVAEVVVRGNEKIPPERVLEVVSTKVNDPLDEERLRNDVQAILNLGEFADAVVRLEPVPEGVRVVFLVVENPVVQQIEVKGNTVIPTADILGALGVQTGSVLNTITMRNGARAVEKLYQDKGYGLAHVSDVSVSPEGMLTLTVAEGRIEAVKIEGLQKTHEYVVTRELTFKPGDVFNINAVNISLKRLFQLQYFSDVKAQPSPGTQPETVVVTILVTEQKTATVGFGAGYSNVTGIEGFITVRDSNFGGNGQTVQVQYTTTAVFGTSYGIAFHEPYFLGTRTALDLQGFNQVTIPTDYSLGLNNAFQYNLTQTGGSVQFTSPLDPINSIIYGFRSVTSTFGQPFIGTPPPAGFVFTPGQVNALLLGVSQDTRNDPTAATSGEHIIIGAELAFQVLGGSFAFQKYEVDYTRFFPVGAESTIVGRVHVGYSPVPMPLQEQFFLGGQSTLRGFAISRFRGDEEALVQVEYHFPLSQLPFMEHFTGISMVLFFDAGDAQPTGGSLSLKTDVGIGFQVKTPVGPFRIDYGMSNEGGQLWVSTGALF